MADESDPVPERILRNLLALQAETAVVDFKRDFDGSTKAKGELIKCIMAFANSKDGGQIIFGVVEQEDGRFVPVGISEQTIARLDPTKIADLAVKHCSELPDFTVYRVALDGMMIVMVEVREVGVGPVVCSTQLQDEHHRMVLRAGAIYTRTQAAKCDEILSAEEVTSIVHRAAAKYASDLTLRNGRPTPTDTLTRKRGAC